MKVNRENINEYYEKVNSKIDNFFGKGVTPEGLKRYLKRGGSGIQKFMKREGLEDIDGIEKVIEDCLEDRVAMNESVKTFEAFQSNMKYSPFNISQDIDQTTEKMLADLYKVSLGHVESDYNHVTLTGIKMEKELYVFTSSKIKEVIVEVCNKVYDNITSESFQYPLLDISFKLENKINKEEFINNLFSDIYSSKESILEEILMWETEFEYDFKLEKNGVFVFEKHR